MNKDQAPKQKMNLPNKPGASELPASNGAGAHAAAEPLSGISKYEDVENVFQVYDGITKQNLEALDDSFNKNMQFLDFLLERSGEEEEEEEKKDQEDKKEESKRILSDKFIDAVNDNQFRRDVIQYNRSGFLEANKFSRLLSVVDYSKNVQLKIFELESKELPEAVRSYEKKLTEYKTALFETDMAYKNQVLPVGHTDELVNETQKLLDVPSYKEFKLEENDDIDKDMQFLDLKIIKSERYLAQIKHVKAEKFKQKLLNEALNKELQTLDQENVKWQDRKNSLIKFLREDLQNISSSINKVQDEIAREKQYERKNVSTAPSGTETPQYGESHLADNDVEMETTPEVG